MKTTTALLLSAMLLMLTAILSAGCQAPETDEDADFQVFADDGKADSTRSWKMPKSMLDYEAQQGWGNHHVQWHVERRWDLLSSSDLSWAKGQGYARASKQEGAEGNGLEFLAMHRMMMNMLIGKFPKYKYLFAGWETPPTNPRDKSNPLPHNGTTPFDDNMLDAISELETKIDSFTSDDDLGLYLETALRPTSSNPSAHSKDLATGIHNYLHNRFADQSNPVDIGNPQVNLGNQLFWRLHGWIDATWTAYRKAQGLNDNTDAAYQAAMTNAMQEMMHCCPVAKGTYGAGADAPDMIPDDILHPVW
jgi:hypothetical protein